MLNRMCISDVGWCRNIEVMNVHGRLTACMGWNMPKPSSSFNPLGHSSHSSSSTIHTATQISRIAVVMTGPLSRHW